MTQAETHSRAPLASAAREMMEALNVEAAPLNIWLRTQANAPSQRPWFKDTELSSAGALAAGRVAAAQMKAKPHLWKWREISPYLEKIAGIAASADVPPIEFADRQQFLLTNPGLGGRLQIAGGAALRCVHLQSRRRRARASAQPQREPHDPVATMAATPMSRASVAPPRAAT